jgi:hypothetical protein
MQVKVANGEIITSSQQVDGLEWWAQGHTFHTTMRVLDISAYDAILGYDWLSSHKFQEQGKQIYLQGGQNE